MAIPSVSLRDPGFASGQGEFIEVLQTFPKHRTHIAMLSAGGSHGRVDLTRQAVLSGALFGVPIALVTRKASAQH